MSRIAAALISSGVAGEPGNLCLDQLEQADVAEPVGVQERADRHSVPGETARDLKRLGWCRDLGRVEAVFQYVQKGGDVPGQLLRCEGADVLVLRQFGKLAAHALQQGLARLVRPRSELLSQTAEERVDIGPHKGIVRKQVNPCHRVRRRLPPRGDRWRTPSAVLDGPPTTV
ncbi:hypothetical protein ACFZBE_13530 [Streptomyces sp. NPDC008061]|uniref:hypothetical protein n=1 Tax=Streptomyces sp. NPDC008061 TaxID=3364805 RepID=UPI0036E16ECA